MQVGLDDLEPWKKHVLQCLQVLSDPAFQDRVWIRQEGYGVSFPSEEFSELFEDTGLLHLLEASGAVFLSDVDNALLDLYQLMGQIDLAQSPRALVSSSEWTRVMRLSDLAKRGTCSILGVCIDDLRQ